MPELVSTAAGIISDIGVEIGKKYLKKRFDEKKLKESLCLYIEKQGKYNEICSLSEEIDFHGLVTYLQNDLLDDVINRITNTSEIERSLSRDTIIKKAVYYAQASTDESKLRVARITAFCIDIIKEFYKNKIDYQYYILAADVVKNVNEHTDEATYSVMHELKEIKQRIIENNNLSQENNKNANEKIKNILKQETANHPLFPDYGVDWRDGNLVSVPLTLEAKLKYPVKYSFTGPIKVGGKLITDSINDILSSSYRHQIQLVMEVEDAKKYLGEMIDPYKDEVESLKGKELYINPPEFPPAFPCSIMVKDKVYFEYVLMRTEEILDDGTYIISNKEQSNTHFKFVFKANIKEIYEIGDNSNIARGNVNFNISISDATNMEMLKYIKFIKDLTSERDLKLHLLEKDQDLFAGKFNGTAYKTEFSNIDEEIDFIERICDIERHFKVSLNIEGEIFEREYRVIQFVSELVRNDEVDEIWETVSFTGNLDEKTRENLLNIDNSILVFTCVSTCTVDLFGAQLDFKFFRTFYDAIIDNPEKIKKIVEASDIGDPIKITLKSVGNKKATSTLKIPEYINDENL